jgi:hypothetical protein
VCVCVRERERERERGRDSTSLILFWHEGTAILCKTSKNERMHVIQALNAT